MENVTLVSTLAFGHLANKILIVFLELIAIVEFAAPVSLQQVVQMVNVVIGVMVKVHQETV
jgi:hypothetical protein